MKPKRLEECLETIRWSPPVLATSLHVDDSLVEQWLNGTTDIPTNVASWVEALCFTHEAAALMRPALAESSLEASIYEKRPEHIPVYSYNLLRRLGQGPVALATLFGTDDEAAVFFLVSRGLAERTDDTLSSTTTGRRIGEILSAQ